MSKNKKKTDRIVIPVGEAQRLVEELPPLPDSEIVPPGILSQADDPAEGVGPDDVEAMRRWSEEDEQ
ncbi:MAG: hypothetical protein VB021_02080 [Oscillospiraceae bacterium]|nr:hypothetical protein [Oscillospiraceae bacterium]